MTDQGKMPPPPSHHPATWWAILGVLALLSSALYRLGPRAYELFGHPDVQAWQWGLTALWVIFMAWSEGYKGFQKAFSPRVVARAFALPSLKRPLLFVFAPLFAMALIHARKGRLIVSRTVVAGIVILVISVRQLPFPYRGMIDAGVVVGLLWGAIAVVVFFVGALRGNMPQVPLDMPGDPAPPGRKRRPTRP